MKSAWNNPSFIGEFLPSSRELTDRGFTAAWKVNQFNRNYPQEWYNDTYELYASSFGVKLLIPVDEYQKTMRTSKYGIMIILLTFVSFFMIEIFNKKALHPIQYLLIGLSLVIFYSILLALSEYMLFQYSYLISSVLVIVLISFYTSNVYSKVKLGVLIGRNINLILWIHVHDSSIAGLLTIAGKYCFVSSFSWNNVRHKKN